MKKRTVKLLLYVIVILCIGVACFSGYKLYSIGKVYHDSGKVYNNISNQYTDEVVEEIKDAKSETSPKNIDFDKLKSEVNPEIVAWLYCPDTVIDYPVVQHMDNFYYLNHTADNADNRSGAIFLNSANRADFSDRNSVIHGHNLHSGQMFHVLGNWAKQEWYDGTDEVPSHKVMYLNTAEHGNYKIELISYMVTPDDSDVYRIEFSGAEDMKAWTDWILEQSMFKADYEFSPDDQFVSMSTCQYNYENARGVLTGKLIRLADTEASDGEVEDVNIIR